MVRTAALLLALAGCSASDRDWHGFVLGERPTTAAPDGRDPRAHVVRSTGAPGFPWQSAMARLDRNGAVMAITLSTDCCTMQPLMDVPPSADEWARVARRERAVPDRFVEGRPPPAIDDDWDRHPRTISLHDMDRYAAAAMAEAVRRLGPPTSRRRDRVFSPIGAAQSAIEDPVAVRAVWQRAGRTVALLDADHESVCLSVVSPDVPHPPLDTACGGVRMDCPGAWYPGDRTGGDAASAIVPPPIVAPPGRPQPACHPD